MSEQSSTPDEAQPESFVSHLIELRDRLLRSVIVVLIVFIPAAIFSGQAVYPSGRTHVVSAFN